MRSLLALLLFVAVSASCEPPLVRTPDGFAVPQPNPQFHFPRDHGSHPEFRIEWWYVTGHLWDHASNRFGFQITFFRSAGPRTERDAGTAAFGTDQVFLTHAALLDVTGRRFLHQERLNREGWDAGASTNTLRVWNGNGSLEWAGSPDGQGLFLKAGIRSEAGFDLVLRPIKPRVVFGTNGVSRKGASPTAASHYLTFPRLAVEGRVATGGVDREVRGHAWMDHEFSSSQLGPDQEGWDWASLQLADGREIMCYRMRRKDGGIDPFSTLAWIDGNGRVTHLGPDQFRFEPQSRWRSPHSHVEYPMDFRLTTHDPSTGAQVELRLEPLALDQELAGRVGGVPYWEGACRVLDGRGRVVGDAYLELAGHGGNLGARLR